MITAIREVRRARGMTLTQVAAACDPPTTAQTIGRLEVGTRNVSLDWLRRIAAALDVEAADLVRMPDRADLPVIAVLDARGVRAPRRRMIVTPPLVAPGQVAIVVQADTGGYRAGDALWCDMLPPEDFAQAMARDVLVPAGAGRYVFGRLAGCDPVRLDGVADALAPAWLAHPTTLTRRL